MAAADPLLISRLYQDTRARIASIVTEPDGSACGAAVVACPGWSVRDVVAHVTAVAEDWGRGSLTGPPTDAQTAAQVARFDGFGMAALLVAWTAAAERLDQMAETDGVAAPLGDVVAHEHDIRGAVGRPGARDSEAVWQSSDQLLANLRTPVPLRVIVEDGDYRSGPQGGPEIWLRTSRFEALRWRTGRRSRAQLNAMDWSDDPAPVLDHLYLFGPAAADVVEHPRPAKVGSKP
jgi:Mycothiol maleylpyruvate isomerase N-terminal domain